MLRPAVSVNRRSCACVVSPCSSGRKSAPIAGSDEDFGGPPKSTLQRRVLPIYFDQEYRPEVGQLEPHLGEIRSPAAGVPRIHRSDRAAVRVPRFELMAPAQDKHAALRRESQSAERMIDNFFTRF